MLISKIQADDYLYFNMHAEEVVTSNFIEGDNVGIFGDRLQINTFKRVFDVLLGEKDGIKNIVLDFQYINACQLNLNKLLFDLKQKGYKILFINIKKALCDELALSTISNKENIIIDDIYSRFFLFEDSEDPFTSAVIDPGVLFDKIFKKKIKLYIDKHSKPHTSSYVYLTSYVDVKKFISMEKELMLFSLYKLALKIKREWKVEIEKDPILICQSLNSAYIVSVLSNLLKFDILILDKIGPINKLYNRPDRSISQSRKYIVVSDLVCLGTEVKIVKNIIQFIGGKFLGNVSLIKTETLSKADIKRVDATIAVFSINKSNNKELQYNIKTDLENF